MMDIALYFKTKCNHFPMHLSPYAILGILAGIIMPFIAALLYPTYTHIMERPWVEWTRLQELPFVACEILVMHWALRRGMNSASMWRALPSDIRIASIILLIGVFTSSVFISAAPLNSIVISLVTVVHLLFAFSVYYLLTLSPSHDFSPLIQGLGIGLILLAILTALKFGFPPLAMQVPGGMIEWSSALPGFINVRHFGSWTGAVTATFLVMLLYSDDKQKLSWMHFYYFLAAAMTVWSGTRAAILALILTTGIIVLMNRHMPSFRAIGILAMLTGAATTAAWLLLPYGDPAFLLFAPSDVAGTDQLTGGRMSLWAATYDRWLDSVWLGWGSGSVFWEVFVNWTHTQPHNVILQFLISWGLVGATGALWLLGRAILAAHKQTLRRPHLQPLLAIIYVLLLQSLLEGMLHYPRFIMLIMILFAAILVEKANEEKQPVKL